MIRKSCFKTSIYYANSKLLRCCNVQSELPLIAGALCTRIVPRFLQVFQTFRASSYKAHENKRVCVITATRMDIDWRDVRLQGAMNALVKNVALRVIFFWLDTCVTVLSHFLRLTKSKTERSCLSPNWLFWTELSNFSFLKPSVSFRLDSALKNRTVN